MDDSTQELHFWFALIAGLFLTYQGASALVTKVAHAGRGGRLHLEGQDAVLFGWVALVAGIALLLFALVRFLENRRN